MKNLTTLFLTVLCTLYAALSFATSYTWNGTTSTAWATSTNWTPNGVPGSGDNVTIVTTGNQPAIAANTSVTDFTMTSGTLSLATYTLNVSGTLTCNGGTINDGTLNASGTTSTFAGTIFGAVVTVNSASVNLNGSKFNNNATFTKTGSGNNFGTGGNVFNDTLIANQNGSGYFVLGFTDPDTFNYAAYFNSSANYLVVGYAATDNYFAGDVYANCTGTEGVLFNYSGTTQYMGNIYLACSDASGIISFGQSGGSATLAVNKTFIEAGAGFSAGFVDIYNFTKHGTIPIDLDFGSSTGIGFKAGNTINGPITWVGGQAYLNGTVFNDDVSFTQNLALDSYSSGGNTFNGDAAFINNTANHTYLANTTGDDFNGDVTFTQNSTGLNYPGYNSTSYYSGGITLDAPGYTDFGYGSTLCRNVFDGNKVQELNGTGFRFKKLKVSKSGGYVTINNGIDITDSLVFDRGILKNPADYVVVYDNCKAVGASDSSYVEGATGKIGNDAFTYPVGRNGHYRPITMSAPASTGDMFSAGYFNKNSGDTYSHSSKDGSIAGLSRTEYWMLERFSGSSTVNVTLSWDTLTTSSAFSSAANLKVCAWDGGTWKDKGNGGTAGNLVAGTVITSSASSVYGAFTLGTSASFTPKAGISCTDAIDMGTGDECFNDVKIYGNELWFKITADSTSLKFVFDDLTNYKVDTIELYESCGGSSVTSLFYDLGNKAMLKAFDLTVSADYFVKVIGSAGHGSVPTTNSCNTQYYYRSGGGGGGGGDCEDNMLTIQETPPDVEWQRADWYNFHPGTQTTITQAISGEDWWYDHKNAFDAPGNPDKQIGYVLGGYSTFYEYLAGEDGLEHIDDLDNVYVNEAHYKGCFIQLELEENPDTCKQEFLEYHFGGAFTGAKMAVISVNGKNMIWYKLLREGYIQRVIQCADGGYLGVGSSKSTRKKNGDALGYNPMDASHYGVFSSEEDLGNDIYENCVPGDNVRHAYVVKMDADGNIEWEYIYGNASFYDNSIFETSETTQEYAYLSVSEGWDVVEANGLFRVVGRASDVNIDGTGGPGYNFVFEIDQDGYFKWSNVYRPGGSGFALGITSYVSGGDYKYVICGRMDEAADGGGVSAYVMQMGEDAPTSDDVWTNTLDAGWGNTHKLYGNHNPNSAVFEVDISNTTHNIILPVLEADPIPLWDGNNVTEGMVYIIDPSSGSLAGGLIENPLDLGQLRAYDMKMGVCATEDGGYGIVSSCYGGPPLIECGEDGYGPKAWSNSNAFVAKVNADNILEWATSFDSDPVTAPNTDQKHQECLYSITQAPDGGFVVAGNCSYNWDDDYLVKLHSDCGLRQIFFNGLYDDIYDVYSDATWNFDRKIRGSVIIHDGATLTVSGATIEFADSRSIGTPTNIIVEIGGKLVLENNAVLTSLQCCNEMWDGVQVRGNSGSEQDPDYQGMLVMSDGASIENARIGVNLSEEGDCCGSNGGIIQAEDCSFKNCRKAVQFMIYPFPSGGYESESYFTGVNFYNDNSLNDPSYNNEGSNIFVSIWAERGIDFTDCTFEVADAFAATLPENKRSVGIAMIDGKADCIQGAGGNLFKNLHIGLLELRSISSVMPVRFSSIGSTFDNCIKGAQIEGGYQDLFQGNTFQIPRSSLPDGAWGIYNYNSLNYTIIENVFEDNTVSGFFNRGVISRGLSNSSGHIWGNFFNGLVIGNQTEMQNPKLQIRCNTYDEYMGIDWVVNPFSSGILGPQGTNCTPTGIRAGNVFYNSNTDRLWNFAPAFKYVYSNDDIYRPFPLFNPLLLDPCGDVVETSCAELIGVNGGIVIGIEIDKKVEMGGIIDDFETEYTTVEGTLDNGQHSTMLTNIANVGYSNSTLTSDLIANSPLSDEVLSAACARTSFSSMQKVDFIVPNCPVSFDVWQDVVAAFAGPVPGDIITAQNESAERTLAAISEDKKAAATEYVHAINNILFYYADNNKIDSLTWYLHDTLTDDASHVLLVGTMLDLKNATDARTYLEEIDLDDNTNEEAVYDFYDIAVSLAEEDKSWFDMDGTQTDKIIELAASEFDVAVNAQAVLSLVFDSVYNRTPEALPESKWEGYQPEQQQTNNATPVEQKIGVYPNPFNNSFTINYRLEQEATDLKIEVYDLTGRTILMKKYGKSQLGNINVDLGECLGIYLVRVFADDKQVYKEKLICIEH